MKLANYTETPFRIQLSFDHPIGQLKKLAGEMTGDRAAEAQLLLEEVSKHPELSDGLTTYEQLEENKDLIRRLLKDYFPEILTHNEIKAVGLPYRKVIFNHTERFKAILKAAGDDFEVYIRGFDDHQFYVVSCCLIMNEFYGTQLDFGRPLFYDIPTADGIIKHYRILYNADYLDILPTEKAIPLTPADIDLLTDNYYDIDLWKSKFPRDSYIFRGFAIMTLYDATIENAVSIFKEKLLLLDSDGFQVGVESIFRSIYRIPDIEIGFTLFDQKESMFSIADFGQRMKSFILPEDHQEFGRDVLCVNSFQKLIQDRAFFAVSDTSDFRAANPDSRLAKHLAGGTIKSFILAPVMKNDVLLGVFEVVSPRVKELNSINANKLTVVMPFLTDSIDRLIGDLQNQVQALIQEKYTTIHSSVYWKFREEAEHFLFDHQHGDIRLEEIVFPDVYPLYGQVDIKGSSEARNTSVQNDLRNQLMALLAIFTSFEEYPYAASFEEEKQQLNELIADLLLPLKASTEQLITNYVDHNIHERLHRLTEPELVPAIRQYFTETTKPDGRFHHHRKKYEATIFAINEKMATVIDSRQVKAQQIFPHYYERFKTDGVEHNLYIGPSIAPQMQFNLKKLYELRLWQLRVLCEMEAVHEELRSNLPYPLEVTTLVLVYNITIAIRFRMDEKRFDVDGSYNARFEIVKKRIDKAHIKNTEERITQTGKITVVYANESEYEEYMQYFKVLQAEDSLTSETENFDVEDLQGISGLKALRVKIKRK